MTAEMCTACRKPKAALSCEICHDFICKNCAHYLENGTFSFLQEIPDELTHTYYCAPCFSTQVEPALESYHGVLERAKNVYFFFSSQKRSPPVIKRAREKIQVKECADRDETILRLGFFAAQQGFNGVIEADITCEKIRNEGYQKSRWQGTGIPANVDAERLERSSYND